MNRILLSLLVAVAAVSAMAVPVPGSTGTTVEAPPDIRSRIPKTPAAFRGGDMVTFCRYVLENLTFPEDRYTEGARFRMSVLFRVAKNGKVKDAELSTPSGDGALDAEVLRVVGESTGWTPRQGGAPEGCEMLRMSMMLVRGADGALHAEDYAAYLRADVMPKFEGGGPGKFTQQVVSRVGEQTPEGTPIDERVVLRFVIEKDGSMSDVSVGEKTPAWLIERLKTALNGMPCWTPAEIQGQKVRVMASLKLHFGAEPEGAKPDSLGGEDLPLLLAERMPAFKGGDLNAFREWVGHNVKYPLDLYKVGVEGHVVATFIIEKDGTLSGVKILRSSDPEFSREVVSVLEMSPKWTPGEQGGKTVRVKYTIPVDFRIPPGREYQGAKPSEMGRSRIRQF